MKRTIFTTATVFTSCLLLASLAIGSGMDTEASGTMVDEGHMSGTAMDVSSQQVAAQPLNMDQIRELQTLLNDQGYDSGVPDGIMGQSTTAAIRQFQTDNQLTNSGTPDQETLRLLSPDAEKQEFFGLAPEFGEQKDMMDTEPIKQMEETPKTLDY